MSDEVIKVVYLARRNPALTADDFPGRWRQHSLLGGSIPALRGLFTQIAQCLNIYDRAYVPRVTLDHDGVNLLTLKDRAAAQTMWQRDDVHEVMLPDELATFSTYVRHFSLHAVERLISDGPMQPYCLISFLKRDRRLALDAFANDLVDALGAVGGSDRRSAVNLIEDRPPGYDFDAITESWFASPEEAAAVTRSPDYKAYAAQRAALCDESRTIAMMTRINHAWPAIQLSG